MGLLSEGEPLPWNETKKWADHVRQHGVLQFIELYKKLETRKGDVLKWGDEVEYNLVRFDGGNDETSRKAQLLLRAEEMLKVLQVPENEGKPNLPSLWRPEYAAYMVEGTPATPFKDISDFNVIQSNMQVRREEIQNALKLHAGNVFSMSTFPRIGCEGFTYPEALPEPKTSFTRSLFWPNAATFHGHPRFKTLTSNIRERRGEKVCINVPVYMDKYTKDPFEEEKSLLQGELQEEQSRNVAKPGHVYMDAMGFGMGLSCLQITFQACCLEEAETLYDQLAPLCPIMLALTAATPFARGYLTDVDCRWDHIAASVDDRTKEERGEAPLSEHGVTDTDTTKRRRIPKSRYDSISSYLSECNTACPEARYNDISLVHDEAIYNILREAGIQEHMAKHVAHLFIRDTVSLFGEKINQNDKTETDHFENIQSTNWQTMRFKPPPPNSEIGWRIEFRPCELQFTDFENAAVCCFVVLLTRVILSYKYNILVPISKVDENMKRAQKRDAILNQRFYFRRNITDRCNDECQNTANNAWSATPIIDEMTLDEIFNGKHAVGSGGAETLENEDNGTFPGLIPLVQEYLRNIDIDTDTMCTLSRYFKLIRLKASGGIKTNARFMRDFVRGHPDYQHDSKITDSIQYDLLQEVKNVNEDLSMAEKRVQDLLKF